MSDISEFAVDNSKEDLSNYNLNEDPKISIELIAENIKDQSLNFSLKFESVNLKSTNDFIIGYPVAYSTSSDFIGVYHYPDGYDFLVQLDKKEKWYNSWEEVSVNGTNTWRIQPYEDFDYTNACYRLSMTIYPHYYQSGINYRIAYSADDHRCNSCSLGWFDGRNCFVLAAPSGTEAFVYPNDTGWLYYTPASGSNPCPAGGVYDTNCRVAKIPDGTRGFVYQNCLYVLPDVID